MDFNAAPDDGGEKNGVETSHGDQERARRLRSSDNWGRVARAPNPMQYTMANPDTIEPVRNRRAAADDSIVEGLVRSGATRTGRQRTGRPRSRPDPGPARICRRRAPSLDAAAIKLLKPLAPGTPLRWRRTSTTIVAAVTNQRAFGVFGFRPRLPDWASFPAASRPDSIVVLRLALKEVMSGAMSGIASAIATAPLDLAKTRMQVQQRFKDAVAPPGPGMQSRYGSLASTIGTTLREEGPRGLFKGLGSTVFGLVPNWAIYFSTYGRLKQTMSEGVMSHCSPNAVHIVSAIGAGAITTCATNPIWLIKVRLQTQHGSTATAPKYKGIADAFVKVFREEGVRGFYRGLPASLIGVTHVAIQFPLYEALKKHFGSPEPDKQLGLWALIKSSSVSKVVACSITYPHEVVRARFQKQGTRYVYTSLVQCVRRIYDEEGVAAFFRGMTANLIRVVPACAVTFTSFEYCMRALNNL